MDGIDKLIDSIKRIIRKETEAYDTAATVRRIEGNTAWVHIDGGVDETPVKLTINAQPGDNVQVRVSGGKAFLVGNGSAPPTDDRVANYARSIATTAQTTAEGAQEAAEAVTGIATAASNNASAAITLAEGIDDHFWSDSAGAHITEDTQEDYLDDPSAAGGNTLITSAGMAVRHGTTQLAAFTASGSQIGQSGEFHVITDSSKIGFYEGADTLSEMASDGMHFYNGNPSAVADIVGGYSGSSKYAVMKSGDAMIRLVDHDSNISNRYFEASVETEDSTYRYTGGAEVQGYRFVTSADKYKLDGTTEDYVRLETGVDTTNGNALELSRRVNGGGATTLLSVDKSGNANIPLGSKYMVGGVDWHCYGNYHGLSSSLTLATSDKKVALGTFSGSGCSSSSNGIKIDANHAGTYSISGAIYASTGYTANDIVHAVIYKNSTLIGDTGKRVSNGSPYEIISVGPLVVDLAAGDVVYLYARNQSGARGTVASYGNTQLNVGLNLYRIG